MTLPLHFIAADSPKAQGALQALIKRYGQVSSEEAEAIIALGGDGLMLDVLHRFLAQDIPVYGMNRGSVGFLMNPYDPEDLLQRIEKARHVTLEALQMTVRTNDGSTIRAAALNEVSLLRETRQAAKLRIIVDGTERMKRVICDGIILSTPAGSTAYNLSAHGPILPLRSNLLALTPISPFRPRRWRGALLPRDVRVTFEVLEPAKRPVSAVADFTEVRDVARVQIKTDPQTTSTLLFDPDQPLDERILKEQFLPDIAMDDYSDEDD